MANNVQDYERDFERMLWDEGWASFRVSGSGSAGRDSIDLVAFKDDRALIAELKPVRENLLPYDVSYNSVRLGRIEERISEDIDVDIGFAVNIINRDVLRWCDWYVSHLPEADKMEPVYKVIEE